VLRTISTHDMYICIYSSAGGDRIVWIRVCIALCHRLAASPHGDLLFHLLLLFSRVSLPFLVSPEPEQEQRAAVAEEEEKEEVNF
jgi:hypothetical protein